MPIKATCIIKNRSVNGIIQLTQNSLAGPTSIQGFITGLSQGSHGFNIHEFGDISDSSCSSTGEHYNPFRRNHGSQDARVRQRHVGDLGNIVAGADGVASFSFDDKVIKLRGPHSVVGRTLVVHQRADDLGKGNHEESLTTGNAGPGLGCCVIGIADRN